jgi:hypothetical protein
MVPRDRAGGGGSRTKCGRWTARVEWRRKWTPPAPISSPSWRLGLEPRIPPAAYNFQRRSSNANSLWRRALVEPTQVITQSQIHSSHADSRVRVLRGRPRSPVIPLDFGAGFQAGHRPVTTVPEPQKRHLPTGSFVIAHHGGMGRCCLNRFASCWRGCWSSSHCGY